MSVRKNRMDAFRHAREQVQLMNREARDRADERAIDTEARPDPDAEPPEPVT